MLFVWFLTCDSQVVLVVRTFFEVSQSDPPTLAPYPKVANRYKSYKRQICEEKKNRRSVVSSGITACFLRLDFFKDSQADPFFLPSLLSCSPVLPYLQKSLCGGRFGLVAPHPHRQHHRPLHPPRPICHPPPVSPSPSPFRPHPIHHMLPLLVD